MTRASSSRSVIAWSVSSPGTSWSKRRYAPSAGAAAGTTSTRTEPASAPSPAATARIRATSGAASRARCSKSSVVTARPRVRSRMGPRTLAFSMSSPSTPPLAARRFSTRATNGIDDFSTVSDRAATLPLRPPPVRYERIRSRAFLAGTAPYWRIVPSASRTAGPRRISPPLISRTKCRSVGVEPAKSATSVHSSQPSSLGDLEHRRLVAGDDGAALEREPLAGHAVGDADVLALDELRVHRLGRPADRDRGEARDRRRRAVRRLALERLGDPGPDPAGPLLRDERRDVRFAARGRRRRRRG